MRLDSHQHFWSYDAQQYPWIPKGSALQRDWLPNDLAPLLAKAGLELRIQVTNRDDHDDVLAQWERSLSDETRARLRAQGYRLISDAA